MSSGYGAIADETVDSSTLLRSNGRLSLPSDVETLLPYKNVSNQNVSPDGKDRIPVLANVESNDGSARPKENGKFLYCVVYALVNTTMCVPCLFGYAAVIFNNDAFQPHINALSKLVLWSSVVHQFSFTIFSTLPFSIGQVQDAGLIFLSHMSNTIADTILEGGGTVDEVVSTTLVLLSIATASLGFLLVLMGKFGLADAVSYLPLPVVGGYLAFIGYFCIQQGVALCISESMMGLLGWVKLFNQKAMMLALPGFLSGIALALISRKVENDAALPLAMVALPVSFYAILLVFGVTLDESREHGWVGEVSPPVPVTDLFHLIDFSQVHWDLISSCLSTWFGMVFVVSFSSCLDVAAISMDMGEPLNVNMELVTVGISNFASGMTIGFTGSYIFSQTIFTYRTGTNSRWVGILVALSFIAVVVSTVNVLQIVPLFFLGSTLIFIGIDLVYEWVIEVRYKLLLAEYCVLLVTFVAIQFLGINAGIFLGIVVAIGDFVYTSARVSSVTRVSKRSRAIWKPDQFRSLQQHCYHEQAPKIMTLEIKGTVFFGSALQLLSSISEEIGIKASADDMKELSLQSPRLHRTRSPMPPSIKQTTASTNLKKLKEARAEVDVSSKAPRLNSDKSPSRARSRPRFVVLDLSHVPKVDASAARGCFLQLAKMCARNNIVLCAAGCNARVDWMLRSHDIAYSIEDEESVIESLSDVLNSSRVCAPTADRVLIFDTLSGALELCESCFISELGRQTEQYPLQQLQQRNFKATQNSPLDEKITLSLAFTDLLGLNESDTELLHAFECDEEPFHDENQYQSGEVIFEAGTQADSFFVVLSGAVAVVRKHRPGVPVKIVSGAGNVRKVVCKHSCHLGEVSAVLRTGNVFGFVDFIMDRTWSFSTMATHNGTVVAKLHRHGLDELKAKPALAHIVDKVLLKASVLELSNVTEP